MSGAVAQSIEKTYEGMLAAETQGKRLKGKYRRAVNLAQDARVNGYRVVDEGGGSFRFEAENVQDPVTGKELEGEHRLELKCKKNGQPLLRPIKFSGGRASLSQTECLIFITPRIIINEGDE
jgi:hypothetical protein